MNACTLVNALLEADTDIDYVGDPMAYAINAPDKSAWWIEPHDWIRELRSLGFKHQHNHYQPKAFYDYPRREEVVPPLIEYWSAERQVTLASGEVLDLSVGGYREPKMKDQVALSISYAEGDRDRFVFDSRPIQPFELKRVIRDIIRRLERLKVEYNWNSYTRGVGESVGKALQRYNYWWGERKKRG